ncbi:MAG TPA: CHRD domain-containing protein [Burkholderiales bacterium]|nr:CHRD domain-containing protein [Burkholderiales bacterium]
MTNIRSVLIGSAASALAAGIIVSCGGGMGGYGGGGGGGGAAPAYSVGGTLSGATGTVVLKLNGGSDMSVSNGPFTFGTMVAYGSTFNVQAVDANDRCTVANGAGTMGVSNVTNVAVTCAAQAAQMVVRSALLDGAQEVPPTGAAGIGVGGVIVDPAATHAITGGITFTGLTGNPVGANIHRADTNIVVGLSLASDNATAIVPAGSTLSNADYAELLAGTLYFNVHTTANPNGEIRGPINLQGGVLAGMSSMNFAQEVAPDVTCTGITTTGRGTVIADQATGKILIAYMTHNVINASAGHIHTSPSGPGSNGLVIVPFNNVGPTLIYPGAGAQMTAQNLLDFQANYLYFNIHSTTDGCPSGEIRGDIAVLQ